MSISKLYDEQDGLGLAEHVRNGAVTATELLDEAIARAARWNPILNAIVIDDEAYGRRQIEAGLPDGPFKGVPFLLKNLVVQLKGTETSNGSRLFAGRIADHNSTIVDRYIAAGTVMFGKTSSPELGLTGASNPLPSGPTRNPWDLAYSAGGSSGGAAAAVAAGIVPLAHGSDGGGSIRVPASVCGLVGLKPTRARTPSGPVRGEGWAGLSSQHVLTRSVRDCAAMLDATAGPELGDPYDVRAPLRPFLDEVAIQPRRLRIGMTTCRLDGSEAEPEVLKAMADVARLLEDLGHRIEPFRHEISFEEIGTHFSAITSANVAYSIVQREKELGRLAADDELEHLTRFLNEMGRSAPGINYVAAVNYAHSLARRMATVHERLDVIFGPTCTVAAMPLHAIDMNGVLGEHLEVLKRFVPSISIYNMTGQPSISLPLTWSPAGIPIGSMFTAAFGEDGLLLQLAGELERALPWEGYRPPFPAASASSLQADAPTFLG